MLCETLTTWRSHKFADIGRRWNCCLGTRPPKQPAMTLQKTFSFNLNWEDRLSLISGSWSLACSKMSMLPGYRITFNPNSQAKLILLNLFGIMIMCIVSKFNLSSSAAIKTFLWNMNFDDKFNSDGHWLHAAKC